MCKEQDSELNFHPRLCLRLLAGKHAIAVDHLTSVDFVAMLVTLDDPQEKIGGAPCLCLIERLPGNPHEAPRYSCCCFGLENSESMGCHSHLRLLVKALASSPCAHTGLAISGQNYQHQQCLQ